MSDQPDSFEKNKRIFAAGQCIFSEGELGAIMYIIKSGKVRISKRSKDVEKTLAVLENEDFFGEMAVIDRGLRSATATALVETHCIALDEDLFEQHMRDDTRIVKKVLKDMSARLRDANEQIENLLIRDADGRVAHALLQLARRHGGGARTTEIVLAGMDADKLAQAIGLGADQVAEALDKMERDRTLRREARQVVVSSLERLEQSVHRLGMKEQPGS